MTPPETVGWIEAALALFKANIEFAAPICFLLGFAESIALVSLFVPSTVLFLGIGGAYSASGGTFLPIWLAGAVGACAGDCISYAVGRYFKDDVDRIWPFTKMPGLIPKGRTAFERWGVLSILGGKFVGGLHSVGFSSVWTQGPSCTAVPHCQHSACLPSKRSWQTDCTQSPK